MSAPKKFALVGIFVFAFLAAAPSTALAQDTLCDPMNEDCRAPLLNLINNEAVGIDVAFWFMTDARYSNALVSKWRQGVPIRVLVDPRANTDSNINGQILTQLKDAGIPMRYKPSDGILHMKMMLFAGQGTVQFSGANYGPGDFVYATPNVNYLDEVIYFTTDPDIVNSFKTKFDDLWTNTTSYANYANINGPLTRRYPTFPIHPELNLPPGQDFGNRTVFQFNHENVGLDVVMYRITDRRFTDAVINMRSRGVPVRLISEPLQYRNTTYYWHSWNIDRLYMAGVQIKFRKHAGLMHQKSAILRGTKMVIFGSSNWTMYSSNRQQEHNYFTLKPFFFEWFSNQFEVKWNTPDLFEDFKPLPPEKPVNKSPANLATAQPTTMTLKWDGGYYAHKYDIYFGTTPNPPLIAENVTTGAPGPTLESFALPTLSPGTTYYWRVVGKTMADMTNSGPVWSFTTAGTAPPPASPTGLTATAVSPGQINLSWNNVTGETGYKIERSLNGTSGWTEIAQTAADVTTYQNTGLSGSTTYFYRVRAFSGAGDSGYSNVASATTGANQPPRVTVTANPTSGTAALTVNFTANASDPDGTIASYMWDFGDGGTSTAASPSYTYIRSGVFTARVTVADNFSATATASVQITVTSSSAPDIVLYAGEAQTVGPNWTVVSDSSAAGGRRLTNPDAGVPKINTPAASPASYAEMTFTAEAGRPYRLWLRGRAQDDFWGNDSAFIQFSGSVNSSGQAVYRIGTTSATIFNLEQCSGCGIQGWGWEDNGWGVGVMGPLIYFQTTGTQRIRIQAREDGLWIDQIVLSPERFLNASPGALKNDNTILAKTQGSAGTLAITGVSPPSGSENGGTQVLITGDGFLGGATVTFGDVPADFVNVLDSGTIQATTRAHPPASVDVTVTNQDGQSVTLAGGFTYLPPNQQPEVMISADPSSGAAPLTVNFTAQAADPDGEIVSYAWNFGDGGTSTEASPSHTYRDGGIYTARVIVTDDRGATAEASVEISVAAPLNTPPSVSITATPSSGPAPLNVTFTSNASDPDGAVVAYAWDFGDGGTSTEASPSHTYTSGGTFTARVTVTDNQGATGTASVTINVNTALPDIVLYASEALTVGPNWTTASDITAAGGARLTNPDAGVPKINTPSANPDSYAELTFHAEAGRAYRLWLRGRAQNDFWGNDSAFIQFSDSVDANGQPVFRIGTTSATIFNLEQCSGCGIQGWGWEDNGWGVGVMGPLIYFETTGTHTIRIQAREDGLSIDQIVLSPERFLNSSPGKLKNDATILFKNTGSAWLIEPRWRDSGIERVFGAPAAAVVARVGRWRRD